MEFVIQEIFSYPIETEIYVDKNDVEIFVMPKKGMCDDSFRIILDRRFLALMGIEESLLHGQDPRDSFLFEVDESGIRFVQRQPGATEGSW